MAVDQEMEAVFKSVRSGDEVPDNTIGVDPESGNPVPAGSLPEEVRDDIPAQLSEGEYVVPADVVRYYGVRFFEDLRNQAKMGWAEMEANGRVGGEPVAPEGMEMGDEEFPFSLEELQVVDAGEEQPMMAEGGYMRGYAEGGTAVDVAAIGQEFPGTIVGTGGSSEEYKTYTNEQGMTMTIRFVNGKPVTPIPPGYTEAGSAQEAVAPTQSSDDGGPSGGNVPTPEAVDWEKADPKEFRKVIDTQFSKLGKAVGAVASVANPLIGAGLGLANSMQNKAMLSALDKRIAAADPESKDFAELTSIRKDLVKNVDRNNDGKVDNIVERSGIFGGESSWDKNLKDTDKSGGASFGDTWLGDVLGFDGTVGRDGATLRESMAGARRTSGSSDSNDSGTNNTNAGSSNDSGSNSLAQSVANFFTPDDGMSYEGGRLVEDATDDDEE